MKARATTTISVLRGTSTSGFGDTVDGATVAASGITASLLEQRKTVVTPDDLMVRTVRYITCRVPAGTDVRTGDRIRNDATGDVYVLDGQAQPYSPSRTNDIRLDLRKVN